MLIPLVKKLFGGSSNRTPAPESASTTASTTQSPAARPTPAESVSPGRNLRTFRPPSRPTPMVSISDLPVLEHPIRVEPSDYEIIEEWVRFGDHEVLGVDVVRIEPEGEWQWQVMISALEFVREDPLESELCEALEEALGQVMGAKEVFRDDREKFIVDGEPSGEALALAATGVLDAFAIRLIQYMKTLGGG